MKNYPTLGKIVLASASPRRHELVASLGVVFSVQIPDIDETPLPHEIPHSFAERLATEKAGAIEVPANTVVIAADTIVVHEKIILGKPTNEAHAAEMLARLSGSSHQVITGVCVKRGTQVSVFSGTTEVVFRILKPKEIHAYIASGDPMDKAGAYAIQGGAAPMIRSINGSYTNVVGLPLCELHECLLSF